MFNNTFAKMNLEIYFSKWRGNFIFYSLCPNINTNNIITIFYLLTCA